MIEKHRIVSNFSEIGVDLSDEIVDFCVQLCNRYSLSESDLVDEWMAFTVSNKEDMQISTEGLSIMEKKCLSKKKIDAGDRFKKRSSATPCITDDIVEMGITACYQMDSKDAEEHPVTPTPCRVKTIRNAPVSSPLSVFSPTSYSPIGSVRNKKYDERTNSGEALCSHNDQIEGLTWKTNSYSQLSIQMADQFAAVPYDIKASYEKVSARIQVCRKWADTLSVDLCKNNGRGVPQEPIGIANEISTFTGRIVCDSNGKLNACSILLEGSLANKMGKFFPLQITDVPTCALFPGQVVAIEGRNPTGGKIIAENIFTDVKLPEWNAPTQFLEPREPLQIIVTAGPYTFSDSLGYEPMTDLLKYVVENKPHVVILIGPIVDCAHSKIADNTCDFTFSELYRKVLTEFLSGIKNAGKIHTKVIVMSHYREAGQRNLYPTPCPRIPDVKKKFDYPNLHFIPDPSILSIDGFIVAMTGADILMHLGKEELFVGSSTDRMKRLVTHLFEQKIFYPLIPPAEEMTIDMTILTDYAQIPYIPHLMILPSEMRHFIKCVKGCIVVNPERLTKGTVGGSFAKIQVRSVVENESWTPETHVSVQVVKI